MFGLSTISYLAQEVQRRQLNVVFKPTSGTTFAKVVLSALHYRDASNIHLSLALSYRTFFCSLSLSHSLTAQIADVQIFSVFLFEELAREFSSFKRVTTLETVGGAVLNIAGRVPMAQDQVSAEAADYKHSSCSVQVGRQIEGVDNGCDGNRT